MFEMEGIVKEIRERIKGNFVEGGSHAFDHVERVYNLAVKMAKMEKADLEVVKAAALLHDISRLKEDLNEVECHAEHGAKAAEKILKEVNFPDNKIKEVCHAIAVHRHSKGLKAETKEAEILQDADRLDALGAITIARMFSSGGELKQPIYSQQITLEKEGKEYASISTVHGFYHKILKITPETFNTKFAKRLAEGRYKFVKKFLGQFFKEWEGKR